MNEDHGEFLHCGGLGEEIAYPISSQTSIMLATLVLNFHALEVATLVMAL
jgi:hypothetical protein